MVQWRANPKMTWGSLALRASLVRPMSSSGDAQFHPRENLARTSASE